MTELGSSDFIEFFREIWDKEPFAWQIQLAGRVLKEDDAPWPEAIALPTASGKTACIDIAVFALASQASRINSKSSLSAPRRIFFVVDRRVIVDEAFDRARILAKKLSDAKTGIVKDIADRLRLLSGGTTPLEAHQLRGGMIRSDAWAKSPTQATIVASTVDQLGSRLLFRAYGLHPRMRPIHAALAGNDSLILLDEAHCAQPFLTTLQAIKRFRSWAQCAIPTPFHVTVMSATPPAVTDVFRDESNEGRNPTHPLGRRQLASKPVTLTIAKKAKGKDQEIVNEALAYELVQEALKQALNWHSKRQKALSDNLEHEQNNEPAIVIFCNRVDTARRAHRMLTEKGKDTVLLTGRMRPIDKDDTISIRLESLSVDQSEHRKLNKTRFVVATQTLEVGANLDFDILITECASLDALRQRFGRLNRMGRNISACASIVIRDDQTDDSDTDPIYGGALARTWNWLCEIEAKGSCVDFGISELEAHLPDTERLDELNAPSKSAPVMLPAHVDALAQTQPEPWPSPDVGIFLHGPQRGAADVQVCWRADFSENEDTWIETIGICPPSSPECVPVPYVQMRSWLAGSTSLAGGDVEGTNTLVENTERRPSPDRRVVVRWRGRDDIELLRDASDLKPGDVLAIPTSMAGWRELATLGDNIIPDWGDRAHCAMSNTTILRLHPAILKQWPESEALQAVIELSAAGPKRMDEDPEGYFEDLHSAISEWSSGLEAPRWNWLTGIIQTLLADRSLLRNIRPHPAGGLVLFSRRRANLPRHEGAAFNDEDDVLSSGGFRSLLVDATSDSTCHLDGVADFAHSHCALLGIPSDLTDVVISAARNHDLGKADLRFQAWLKGGNPWARGPLLAKSEGMPQGKAESIQARIRAGYPPGARHELLSVRLMESVPEVLPSDDSLRDLLLHLVESHHGYCRPFAPVVDDSMPIQVKVLFRGHHYRANSATGLERLNAGPAERYWNSTRRYGWWGLAFLETLVRLSDHQRSKQEYSRQNDEQISNSHRT